MTYEDLLEIVEAAARTVDPDGTYYRGRLADISLATVNQLIQAGKSANLIYHEDSTQITPAADINTTEEWRLRFGFLRQDSPSSESMTVNQLQENEESRQVIYDTTLIIARKFLDALYNEPTIEILGTPALNQQTRIFQGTLTGWGLEITVRLGVGCEYETSITDAVYQNALTDPSFQQTIKRGKTFTAPKITVTDSDGSTFEQPANTDVVCTPSASPATAVLKNSAGTTISTTSIDPGTSEDIPAPDATAVLKNTDGTTITTNPIPSNVSEDMTAPDATAVLKDTAGATISTNAIPSNVSEDITAPDATAVLKNSLNTTLGIVPIVSGGTTNIVAPDATAVVKDQHGNTLDTEAIPANVSEDIIITLPQVVELFFAFEAGDDTSVLATNSGTTWTLTSLAQDGSSGTITVSDNGAAYGAFSNPTTITNGETIQVKRTSTGSAGNVTITGTYA